MIGVTFTDLLLKNGEILTLAIMNLLFLLVSHLMMKCLPKKKKIKSSKVLTFIKSFLKGTIKGLQWSGFYILFIEGYKDLLEHIFNSQESLNNEFEWVVLIILLIQIFIAFTLPTLGTFCLIKYQSKLHDKAIKKRHGTLYH